ncbi:MAG: hypothetical protein JW927_14875 [Deltaproteobacteria bacterium]|nr:hypothetical protein [Deltaproteobacteria bacterium]
MGAFNLGNGEGCSVKQVIETAKKVTGEEIRASITGRRAGDPAVLIGSSARAVNSLGWKPQYDDIQSIIETAWRWHEKTPQDMNSSI